MKTKTLLIAPELCTGCNRCVYACSAARENMFAPALARLSVSAYPVKGFSAPSVCFQCPRPECRDACPEGAISRGDDGVVRVDAAACTGCGACVEACSWGMIDMHPHADAAVKCDLCGGDPACAKECAFGALVFAAPDKTQLNARVGQMKLKPEASSPEMQRDAFGKALLAGTGR